MVSTARPWMLQVLQLLLPSAAIVRASERTSSDRSTVGSSGDGSGDLVGDNDFSGGSAGVADEVASGVWPWGFILVVASLLLTIGLFTWLRRSLQTCSRAARPRQQSRVLSRSGSVLESTPKLIKSPGTTHCWYNKLRLTAAPAAMPVISPSRSGQGNQEKLTGRPSSLEDFRHDLHDEDNSGHIHRSSTYSF